MAKPKLTPKQEKFAQLVARGETYSDAYRGAYNALGSKMESINVNACKLMSDTKIMQRVMELQERAAKRTVVTIQSITEELDEAKDLAEREGQAAAMTGAILGKAKVNGLIVNKSEVTRKRDISELDDAEIDALIASAESGEGEAAESPSSASQLH